MNESQNDRIENEKIRNKQADLESKQNLTQAKKHAVSVKASHETLRKIFHSNNDFQKSWNEYKQDSKNLENYAKSMQSLASLWKKSQTPENSRINWFLNTIDGYFDKKHALLFEKYLRKKQFLTGKVGRFEHEKIEKFKLLDVGSSFGMFEKTEKIDPVSIDLAPANEKVMRCDFLDEPSRKSCGLQSGF